MGKKSVPQLEPEPGSVIVVEHDGMSFDVPALFDDWPVEATEALERGRWVVFLAEILGDQYLVWRSAARRTNRDAIELTNIILAADGMPKAGEPEASSS